MKAATFKANLGLTLILVLSLKTISGHSQQAPQLGFSREAVKEIFPELDLLSPVHRSISIQKPTDFQPGMKDGVFVYGKLLTINLNQEDFEIIEGVSGYRVWAIKLNAIGAKVMDIFFENVNLSATSRLFICNERRDQICGAYTQKNTPISKSFYTSVLTGESLTVYLIEESASTKPTSTFTVGGITYGAAQIQNNARTSYVGDDVKCHFPDWKNESNGIVYYTGTTANGKRFQCSGALVNNERKDRTPYVLTARHCITNSTLDVDLTNAEKQSTSSYNFIVGYRTISCSNTNTESIASSLNGATFRSAWFYSDFALIEINSNNLPLPVSVNYLGWSRDGASSKDIMIAHPQGNPQKYSEGNYTFSDPWKYEISWTLGSGEEGSSGGPLFTTSHQIVGMNSYGTGVANRFGKISASWTGGNAAERQLKPWLSPNQDLNSMSHLIPLLTTGPDRVCYGSQATITMPNLRSSENANWSVSPNLNIVSYTNNSVIVTPSSASSSGTGTITATVNGQIVSQQISVGTPGDNIIITNNTTGNQSNGNTILLCQNQSNNLQVSAINPVSGGNEALAAQWTFPSGWSYTNLYDTYTSVTPTNYGTIDVKVQNQCGWSGPQYGHFNANLTNCGGYYGYSVAPNPAKDKLYIYFNGLDKEPKQFPEKYELFDEVTARKVLSFDAKDERSLSQIRTNKSVEFDVTILPRGRYFLRITRENDSKSKVDIVHILLE